MRIRHFIMIPFLALMLIFGFASFSKGHLDNISIVTCIEIASDDKGICRLRAELADTKEDSGSQQGMRTKLLSSEGASLHDAWNNLTRIDSSIYTGHVRLILLDTETAEKTGFDELSEFILRSGDIRFNTPVALYDSKAGDILDAETLVSGNRGLDLSRSIRSASSAGTNVNTEAFQIINSVGENSLPLLFPVISMVDTGGTISAYVDDTAVFSDGKLIKRGRIIQNTDTRSRLTGRTAPEDLVIRSDETENKKEMISA